MTEDTPIIIANCAVRSDILERKSRYGLLSAWGVLHGLVSEHEEGVALLNFGKSCDDVCSEADHVR